MLRDDAVLIAHPRMLRRADFLRAVRARRISIAWSRWRGHAEMLAARAVRESRPLVIVAGGDGSLHEAANALHGSQTILGIIPGGTGNDLARCLGIPYGAEAALETALGDRARAIDMGRIEFARGSRTVRRVFANIAEAGFGALAAGQMGKLGRYAGSALAYPMGILLALATYRAQPVRVVSDASEIRCRRLTLVAIANGKYFGRGMKPAPEAQVDDGWLDVVVLEGFTNADIVQKMGQFRVGAFSGYSGVHARRARSVEVHGPRTVLVEADGELLGHLPLRVELIARSLRVAVP